MEKKPEPKSDFIDAHKMTAKEIAWKRSTTSKEYRENYDRIFRKKETEDVESE